MSDYILLASCGPQAVNDVYGANFTLVLSRYEYEQKLAKLILGNELREFLQRKVINP